MTLVATVIVASDKMILSLHHTDLELASYMSSVRDNQLSFPWTFRIQAASGKEGQEAIRAT